MARYTIELKDVIAAGHNIFDFRYPFYDESKRADFERKFIQHFYFREIGCPTVDRFKVYLADKMHTVFPYYNKLFEATLIEYDKLNNYNLTEEYETTRENQGKTSGVSSSVGQLFGNQESESKQNRVVDSQGNVDTIGTDTDTETSVTETTATGKSATDTTGTSTTHSTGDSITSENGATEQDSTKKFLDTPQGLTDLTDSKYLTTLNQDTVNSSDNKEGTAHTENDSETSTTNKSETDTTDTSKAETARNLERNTLTNQESTGKETTDDTASSTVKDEQKTTQDNNTRTFSDSQQTEKHKLTRVGNIGVQTGADMVRIHVELQKTLGKIERMFFDECEDLFMLVY